MGVLKVNVISLPYIFQVLYVLCFTRPRYQVSVYRTIGPLVFFALVTIAAKGKIESIMICSNLLVDKSNFAVSICS